MKPIISSSLFLLVLLSLSEFVFKPSYLYYELWWLDIPMHILGGFGVASLAYAIFSYKGIHLSYWNTFLAFVLVAVCWEIYEYANGIVTYEILGHWIDTGKDMVDGMVGMSVAYLLIRK